MNQERNTNPILPAAGVRRNIANGRGASLFDSFGRRQYDEGSLNRSRRDQSDKSAGSDAILRCKKPFSMATFNANTAREDGRMKEIVHCFMKCGIEMLGIQEHRRVHEDSVKYSRVEGQYLITSSAWRNQSQAAVGGVGLLLSPKARKSLRTAKSVTERILVAEFDSNPVTTVIVIYSPTNVSPNEEAEEFYGKLGEVVRSIPAHNFLAVLGDFNARLGPEDSKFTYHSETNRNGEFLADLILEQCLLAANTQFRKRQGKRWTFLDKGTKKKRQLDYILVIKK